MFKLTLFKTRSCQNAACAIIVILSIANHNLHTKALLDVSFLCLNGFFICIYMCKAEINDFTEFSALHHSALSQYLDPSSTLFHYSQKREILCMHVLIQKYVNCHYSRAS